MNANFDIPITGRPVIDTLSIIADGEPLKISSAQLAEVTAAVHEHGGTGELTIKIKVKATGRSTVALTAEVTHKKPKAARLPTIMFSDDRGALTQHDPAQMEFKEKDESFAEAGKA